jgi:hypothetical protein
MLRARFYEPWYTRQHFPYADSEPPEGMDEDERADWLAQRERAKTNAPYYIWVTDAFEPQVCVNLDGSTCTSHPDAPITRVEPINLQGGRIDHREFAERICAAMNFCAGIDQDGLPSLAELLDALSRCVLDPSQTSSTRSPADMARPQAQMKLHSTCEPTTHR